MMPKDKNWHGVLDDLYAGSKSLTQDTDTTQQHQEPTQNIDTTHQHNMEAVPARALPGNTERRNQRVQLCFKPSTHRKLSALALSTGISLNNLVNSILEDHIEQHKL